MANRKEQIILAEAIESPYFHNEEKECVVKRGTKNKSICRKIMNGTITVTKKVTFIRKVHNKCDDCDYVTRLQCFTHDLKNVCECGWEFGHHLGYTSG